MAQDRADQPEPETLAGKTLEVDPLSSTGELSSIDKLLALTDDGWDLDEQVRTLKEAAASTPALGADSSITTQIPSDRPSRTPALHLPTPFDFGARAESPAPPPVPSRPPPLPSTALPEVRSPPPPAAGEALRSGPPPPPTLFRKPSKGPPPLPGRKALTLRPSQDPTAVSAVGSVGSVSPVSVSRPASAPSGSDLIHPTALVDLLNARLAALETSTDPVGLARTHVELAIASETLLADDARATAYAESALKVDPHLAAAHAIVRRRKHGRSALTQMIAHLEEELAAATAEPAIVELLAEKARLLEAMGDRQEQVRATWTQALTHAPNHSAALKGLESELWTRALQGATPETWDALAAHLGILADAWASEPRLSSWLHVERAQILERRLGRVDAARGAFEQALKLDGNVGPVRDAFVRHVASHGDWAALATMLEEEAEIETLDERSARLELDAASIAHARLGDDERAVMLLERAAQRAPTASSTDRRVLDLLIQLRESRSEWEKAGRARRARLRFVTDPPALAYELRTLAMTAEKFGDLDLAIGDVQRAMAIDASDPTLVETLDRLLGAAGKDEQRVALWLTEAARTDDGTRRARALSRAASLSESVMSRPSEAVRHLRSAWIAAPGDAEVLDSLARLLAPQAGDELAQSVRGLIDLYVQAAEHTADDGRRIAYLEKVALLWDELLGQPQRAAKVYEEILVIDPDRRAAMLGLERTAVRLGDARALARALLDEARLTGDSAHTLSLKTRAAAALAKVDPARSLALVESVLEHDPAHSAARILETRLNEDAGRWELAARSLRARIEVAAATPETVALWIALAHVQSARLHAPLDALASLQEARALDPAHPVPPEEIASLLQKKGDFTELRKAIEGLATHATSSEERLRHLVHAAEIDELRLGDDAGAARLYQRAMAEAPDDELVADRLARVLSRSTGFGELAQLLSKRIEHATSPVVAQSLSFDLAFLLVERGHETPRATALLESIVADQVGHIPALRTLEVVMRRTGEQAPLARVLSRQGDQLVDVRARLGALWNLAMLEEWRLPIGDPSATYRRILELDPTDPGALEATLRREGAHARRGDGRSRKSVITALRALVALASDDGSRLALQLRLALMLETAAAENQDPAASYPREALDRYRDALRLDELSVTAATGLARLSNRLADVAGAIAAASTLAELATDPKVKARYLVEAAELLLNADPDDRLGPPVERRLQAAGFLERALAAEPDSIAAAGRLATVLLEERQGERLVEVFRTAIQKTRAPDAVVMLGSEIARVARDELKDLTIAIDAMRRVREVAPGHVPSLLTLAELCIAQRAWPEAVEALEAVVKSGHEAAPRLTALFALASVYEKVLSRSDDVERVLRSALTIDPSNPRALRALLRRLAQQHVGKPEMPREQRAEVEELLARLSEVERDPEQRAEILLELAEARIRLGNGKDAEKALIEAVATSPGNARAFARLASFYKTPTKPGESVNPARDDASYARALAQVIGRGQQVGRVDARWFATLGQIEVEKLSRMRDGILHMQRATQMEPALYETRFELASAFVQMSAHEEATRVILGMLVPTSEPLLSVSDPPAALELLEKSLGAERRSEEAVVVSELRAVAGELDEGRHAWLRSRRLGSIEPHHQLLDRPTLVTHVLPQEGRHILLEVAAAIAGIEAKMLRSDMSEIGISARDRVGPRSGHPTRVLLDRLARQLGLLEVELVIANSVTRTRVLAQDAPWIIVPRPLTELPEPTQLAALGRAAARIAFGVPWLEEVPPPHIEAMLIAAARQVVPGYAAEDVDVLASKLVTQHEANIARVLSRRQRRLLEELAPHIAAPQGRPMPIDAFISALARGELRAAYVLTGDMLATIDELRAMDAGLHRATDAPGPAALAAVLEHPYAGDIARYALTPEATALRRRLGSTWTG